jgi:hypothetical protein
MGTAEVVGLARVLGVPLGGGRIDGHPANGIEFGDTCSLNVLGHGKLTTLGPAQGRLGEVTRVVWSFKPYTFARKDCQTTEGPPVVGIWTSYLIAPVALTIVVS